MKTFKFLTIVSLLTLATLTQGYSQNITHNKTSKVYNLDVKVPKTQAQQVGKAVKTTDVAIYKEKKYPVYISKKGKLFIVYPNKENTGYNKKYIK